MKKLIILIILLLPVGVLGEECNKDFTNCPCYILSFDGKMKMQVLTRFEAPLQYMLDEYKENCHWEIKWVQSSWPSDGLDTKKHLNGVLKENPEWEPFSSIMLPMYVTDGRHVVEVWLKRKVCE